MAINELQTRIALKYDSYANWTNDTVADKGANLKLLVGELGICEIPSANTDSRVAPTVLFKVGAYRKDADGNDTTELLPFKDLPWASAKAADVYAWAKASDVVLEDKTIKFVGTNKTIPINYITPDEVTAITDPLASRIAAVETAINGVEGGNNGITDELSALGGRLDVLEGADTVEGSVANALKDAKAYADQAEADALADAKTYADGKAATNKGLIDGVAADLSEHVNATNPHNITTATLGLENVDNKSVTTIKAEFTGEVASGDTEFATGGAVYTAIEAAKTAAATTAQNKVDALADGQVKTNTEAIAENAAAIARVEGDYQEADADLDERLTKVETFFEGAAEDGVQQALDTLVEIQTFINTEGTTAQKIVDDIATNTKNIGDNTAAINNLKAIVNLEEGATGGGLAKMKQDIADNAGNIATLQSITKGYSGESAIKTAVDQAQEDATNAGEAAEQAQADATDAKNRVGVLETAINDPASGLAATHKIADDNASDISDLKELTKDYSTVTQNVTDLKAIVETGDNSNAKLRSDIGTIQSIVNGTNGNSALATRIKTVEDAINHTTTGLGALNTAVEDHAGRISAIESDYLKASDQLIFQCGSSSSNTFIVQAATE